MSFTGKYLKPNINLFDNQKYNVKRLVRMRRAILSDRVGSGKSLSTLYSFAYLKEAGHLSIMLVLTPLSAYEKDVWKKDIQKFTSMSCITLDELEKKIGTQYSKLPTFLEKYPIIYGKHSHVKKLLPLMQCILDQPGALLVVDEIHAFRNAKSDLTIKMRDLTLHAKCFWGITGSSISKSMEDLYSIVNLVKPWYFGPFTTFRDYYCQTREKVIGRSPGGKLKKALEIVGIRPDREKEFQDKLAPLLINGESFLNVKFHYIDYSLTPTEQSLYRRIAKGINLTPEEPADNWLSYVLSQETDAPDPSIKDVERFSSRFIYLQSAADGNLTPDGKLNGDGGTKVALILEHLSEIISKGQSCIVYFDYINPLEMVHRAILKSKLRCKVLLSTGEHVLDGDAVTEAKCKQIPHIILGTRASSESASYYFINNVIFYNIPTTTHTFVQLVGRITRHNTLYPDDLNVYIFRSENIDLYKLMVVSGKAYQLELVQGHEANIPDDYKQDMKRPEARDQAKKTLLWLR